MIEEQFQKWLNEAVAVDAMGRNIPRRDCMNYEEISHYRECWLSSRKALVVDLPDTGYCTPNEAYHSIVSIEQILISAGVTLK